MAKGTWEQLVSKLDAAGWSVDEIVDGSDWWAAEHWLLSSQRTPQGLRCTLSLMIDPLLPDRRTREEVWEVVATPDYPASHMPNDAFGNLYLQKGRIEENIDQFISQLSHYRDAMSI